MAYEELENSLISLISPVCEEHGVELVQLRYIRQRGGAVLRAIIDRPRFDDKPGSGVDIDDCTTMSRAISRILDEDEDLIPGAYHLEVSSPGIERPLVKESDFERFAGQDAYVKTTAPVGGRRNFRGRLDGLSEGSIRMMIGEALVCIPLELVSKAHLIHRF